MTSSSHSRSLSGISGCSGKILRVHCLNEAGGTRDEAGRQVIAAVRGIRGSTFNAIVISGDTSAAVHDFDGDSHLCWLRKPTNSALLLTVLQNFTSPL